MRVNLVSWNVNGLRACMRNGFSEFVSQRKPDIICLQEVKATSEQVEHELHDEYKLFWNPAEKAGYSGTAIFTRFEPLSVHHGIGVRDHDSEGRVLTLEYPEFFLTTVYTPNSQRGLLRLDYRVKLWEPAFLAFLKNLEKKKPVVFCGDLNVAHTELDIKNAKANVKNAGFTPQERECFTKLLESGFTDSFRMFQKDGGHYTWWTYRNDARARNIGWRLDYFVVSDALKPIVKDAAIWNDVHGSDHCPVMLQLEVPWKN